MVINYSDYFLENKNTFSTLVDLLRYRSLYQPNQIAYTFLQNGETEAININYQELDRQARTIAALLQSKGASGKCALLFYSSGLEYIAAFFGCLFAGVIAVPLYPPKANRSMSRLQAIITDSQAKIALTTNSILSNVERYFTNASELAELSWLATDQITSNLEQEWQVPLISSDTLAYLQYTSGSTATPKGVEISHGNVLHNSMDMAYTWEITSESVIVSWLPHFHDFGLVYSIIQPIYQGCSAILMSPESFIQKPIRWLKAISHYKGTHSGAPNFAYELCLQKGDQIQAGDIDLSSWCVAVNGAEPIRQQTLERFTQVFAPFDFQWKTFSPGYGLAEATLKVCSVRKSETPSICKVQGVALDQKCVVEATENQKKDTRTLVGCGTPLLGTKVVIVDPESLKQCQQDQVGEILVSGTSVAQGYWKRAKETQHTFQVYIADTGEGPFLRTGDLGFLQNGQLFVTGRIKDIIIIRGRNYYPQDIEIIAEQSHSALRSSFTAAFSVESYGAEQLVIAFEVKRNFIKDLNVDEVVCSVRQAVSEKYELEVYAVLLLKTGSIPKTSSGKIQRYTCRVGFETNSLDIVGEWRDKNIGVHKSLDIHNGKHHYVDTDIEQWLVLWVSQKQDLNTNLISSQKSFEAYGLSSIEIISLAEDLENWLGFSVPPTLLLSCQSIQELAQHLDTEGRIYSSVATKQMP